MEIGQLYPPLNRDPFSGWIGDLMAWNRELSNEEVKEIYRSVAPKYFSSYVGKISTERMPLQE